MQLLCGKWYVPTLSLCLKGWQNLTNPSLRVILFSGWIPPLRQLARQLGSRALRFDSSLIFAPYYVATSLLSLQYRNPFFMQDATVYTSSLVLDLVDAIKPGLVNFRHISQFVKDPKVRFLYRMCTLLACYVAHWFELSAGSRQKIGSKYS